MIETIRSQTRALHERVEQRLNITESAASPDGYVEVLKLLYGFYHPIEQIIPAYGTEPQHWIAGDRRKTSLFAQDFRNLGMTAAETQQIPLCPNLPELSQFAQQLGCMYVLEGSTLGGQFVLRQLRDRLDLPPDETNFFNSYGPNVGAMWRAFCAHLEAASKWENVDLIIASAVSTFESLDRWIQQCMELSAVDGA